MCVSKLVEHTELWFGGLVGFRHGHNHLVSLGACREGFDWSHGGWCETSAVPKIEFGPVQGTGDDMLREGARVQYRSRMATSILDSVELIVNLTHQDINTVKLANQQPIITKLGDRDR